MKLDRQHYKDECARRWMGDALRDAKHNWYHFRDLHDDLVKAMRHFKRNPMLEDLSGRFHNPDCALTSLLWKMQSAWQHNRSSIYPPQRDMEFLRDRLRYDLAYNSQAHTFTLLKAPPAIL